MLIRNVYEPICHLLVGVERFPLSFSNLIPICLCCRSRIKPWFLTMMSFIIFTIIIFSVVAGFDKSRVYKTLFPNQNDLFHNDTRQLATVPCVVCRNLEYCQALNNFMVQENYYPENLNLLGSCYVLEALGKRMNSEIFGPGKSFRDTTECRGNLLFYDNSPGEELIRIFV